MLRAFFVTLARGLGALGAFLVPSLFGATLVSLIQLFVGSADATVLLVLIMSSLFVTLGCIGFHFVIYEAPRFWLWLAAFSNAVAGVGFFTINEWPAQFVLGPFSLAWSFFVFLLARQPLRRIVS